MRIMVIDPSGNFTDGKGTTGYILGTVDDKREIKFLEFGSIKASDFSDRIAFWKAHRQLLETDSLDMVVIEDYRLYNHAGSKAAIQTGSLLETPRLLGLLEVWADELKLPITWQMASQTAALKDYVLVNRGVLSHEGNYYKLNGKLTNDHIRSALRHFLRFVQSRYGGYTYNVE